MFAPEELVIIPVESDSWRIPDLKIEIPPAALTFEEMAAGAWTYTASTEASSQRPSTPVSTADSEETESDAECNEIHVDENGHEYIIITVFGNSVQRIDVTGMTDEEINDAVYDAYAEATLEFELDCPADERYLYE
jgi:hypothetical protein